MRKSLLTALMALAVATSAHAKTNTPPPVTPGPLADRVDAVILKGKDLGELLGSDLEGFQLFAVNPQGQLKQIPFQIDERFDSGELVLIANKLPGTGRMTRLDELVFMARDAGPKISANSMLPSSSATREIEIADPSSGKKGWVYAVVSPVPSFVTPVAYVDYDAVDRRVSGKTYLLHFADESKATTAPLWQADQFALRTSSSALSPNLVKRGFININLAAMGGWIKWQPQLKDLEVQEAGQKSGPIRAIRKLRLHPQLGYGISVDAVTVEQNFFDKYMTTQVTGDMKGRGIGMLSKILVTFGEEVGLDNGVSKVLAQGATNTVALEIGQGANGERALGLWRLSSEPDVMAVSAGTTDCPQCISAEIDGKKMLGQKFSFTVQRFFSGDATEQTVKSFLNVQDKPLRVRSRTIEQNLVLRFE